MGIGVKEQERWDSMPCPDSVAMGNLGPALPLSLPLADLGPAAGESHGEAQEPCHCLPEEMHIWH